MKLDPKLKLLAMVVFTLLACLFYCEHMFPKDGQMFQAVYGLLTGFSAILLNELRKDFGQAELPPDTTLRKTTQATVQEAAPAVDPPTV